MLGILLPAIKDDLNLSDTQIGFITGAAFTILYAFLGVPIASLADRFSRKKIIAAALAAWSAMTCLCGAAQNFVQLAIFRVLVGIGEAGCTPPSHSIISDYFPRTRRTSALAIFGLGSPLGVFIGFLAGGYFLGLVGMWFSLKEPIFETGHSYFGTLTLILFIGTAYLGRRLRLRPGRDDFRQLHAFCAFLAMFGALVVAFLGFQLLP